MAKRPYLLHLEFIEKRLRKLTGRGPFLFAFCCAERTLPVYERAAKEKPWDRSSSLRKILDEGWSWASTGTTFRSDNVQLADSAILEEPEDDVAGIAARVATEFYGLATTVENQSLEGCIHSADGNLGLVEAFVYDEMLHLASTRENDFIVDSHSLVVREMERQREDVRDIEATADIVQCGLAMRRRAEGRSALGEYWFEG